MYKRFSNSDRLTDQEEEELRKAVSKALSNPPTIGVVGVSGVGKSSTINTMFRTNLPVSHTIACTKEFREVPLHLQMSDGPAPGQPVQLVVCDAPGLGEDVHKDPEYISMYRQKLPVCDMILWIMSARSRAIALDQYYLTHFPELHHRIVFGLNQVDLVEPMEWKSGSPIPFGAQAEHIDEIVADRTHRLSNFLQRKVEVVPYSNVRGYNLEGLFTSLLRSCTGNRSWIFGALKNFSYLDFISAEHQQTLNSAAFTDSKLTGIQGIGAEIGAWLTSRIMPSFESKRMTPLTPEAKSQLGAIVGRSDIDIRPLSEDEIAIVEKHLRSQGGKNG